MRKTQVTATAKPSAEETYQVSITIATGYPDALDEARAQAVRGVSELIADAIKQYGRPVTSDDA